MKISTKGRYGLRAMLDLAGNASSYTSLSSIAARQKISENYLEQLIASLKKAKLVKSIRGAQGGYCLNADLDKITVGDILRALEGPLAPVGCVIEDSDNSCDASDVCISRVVWKKIYDKVNEAVDEITLKDLLIQQEGFLTDQAICKNKEC